MATYDDNDDDLNQSMDQDDDQILKKKQPKSPFSDERGDETEEEGPEATPEPSPSSATPQSAEPETSAASSPLRESIRKAYGADASNPVSLASALKKQQGLVEEYADFLDQHKTQMPPDTRQELRDAIQQARENYQTQTEKNDWLEVAQSLGHAIAQYGAAQSGMASGGKYGRVMSNLDFGGIDFQKRNERALQEYNMSLKSAQETTGAERQKWLDEAARQKEEIDRTDKMYQAALGGAGRDVSALRYQAGETAREKARQSDIDKRLDAQERARQEKELADEIKSTQKDKETATAGVSLVSDQVSGDMSQKEWNQAKLRHPRELGSLDKEDIETAKKDASEPGMLYGTNVNKDKFESALQSRVQQKYDQKISSLRQALDRLHGMRQQGATAPSPPAPAASAAPVPQAQTGGRVRVKSPTGQIGSIPSEQLSDALKQGYIQVQ